MDSGIAAMTVFYHLVIGVRVEMTSAPSKLRTDGGQTTFETEYAKRPPSIALVESIAAIEGVPPTDVDFSLYESIDPDALDTLFANSEDDEAATDDGDILAEFRVDGYIVQVRNSGRITVKDTDQSE